MRAFKSRIVAAALAAVLAFANVASAAVTANSQITPQTPNEGHVQFLQGTDVAGTYKTLYTGGANGSVCTAIWADTNDPSAAHLVTVQLVVSSTSYGGVAVNVPVNSGFAAGVPPVQFMNTTVWPGLAVDGNNNSYFYLASASDIIKATFATALTSTDLINVHILCGDY